MPELLADTDPESMPTPSAITSKLDALLENQFGAKSFKAEFRVPRDDGGFHRMTAFDELGGLELALLAALNKEAAVDIDARIAKVTAHFLKSREKPRRAAGAVVRLKGPAGIGGTDGLFQLLPVEDDIRWGCPLCGNFDCVEWPTLVKLDASGAPTDEFAHHVSECEMLEPF
jgi:hypothetical protein